MARKRPFRVGVIGAGAIAQACHIPGYVNSPRAEFVAFTDPEPARHVEVREQFGDAAGYRDYRDMLASEDLDVVSVCTPNKYHADATIAALEAGCHVLCEKPMALTLKEADRMAEAAKAARKKLMIGFTHRLCAGSERCKELLRKKSLGQPFMMRVRFAHGGPFPGWAKSDWFYDPVRAGGGALLDMGIHAIDLCLWLMGPVASVSAQAKTLIKKIDVDDNALLQLEFASGALGYIEVGWTSKPGFTGFEIYGTEGSLICDYIKGLQMVGGKASAGADGSSEWQTILEKPTEGGWQVEIERWLDVVSGTEKLTMDAAAGRAALEVALAAYKSSRTGKRVTLG